MDPIEQLRQSFLIEAEELVIAAENHLTNLQSGAEGMEDINGAFRAIHSIKGGAGAFGFQNLVPLSHALEAALDLLRNGKSIDVESVPVTLFFRGIDAIGQGIACAKAGTDDVDHATLVAELSTYAGQKLKVVAPDNVEQSDRHHSMQPSIEPGMAILRLCPDRHMFRRIVEPRHLIQQLESFGAITVKNNLSEIPDIESIDPEQCYLQLECHIKTEVSAEVIKDLCLQSFDEEEFTIINQAPAVISAKNAPARNMPIAGHDNHAPVISKVQTAGTLGLPPGRAATTTIRVDLERIDKLMNLVGEIVITQSILADQIGKFDMTESSKLAEGIEIFSRQMRELQDNVMAVRAQPVKTVFQRIPRMIRDLSQSLQKMFVLRCMVNPPKLTKQSLKN